MGSFEEEFREPSPKVESQDPFEAEFRSPKSIETEKIAEKAAKGTGRVRTLSPEEEKYSNPTYLAAAALGPQVRGVPVLQNMVPMTQWEAQRRQENPLMARGGEITNVVASGLPAAVVGSGAGLPGYMGIQGILGALRGGADEATTPGATADTIKNRAGVEGMLNAMGPAVGKALSPNALSNFTNPATNAATNADNLAKIARMSQVDKGIDYVANSTVPEYIRKTIPMSEMIKDALAGGAKVINTNQAHMPTLMLNAMSGVSGQGKLTPEERKALENMKQFGVGN